jgi:hypothetical protein
MSKDDTDGKRRATTRRELLDLMKDLKIELGGDDEWLRILGARLREHYPGTYVAHPQRLIGPWQPTQQEPVAWMHTTGTGHVYFRKKPQDKVFNPQPVFTSPPKKQWVGLTLNEAEEFYDKYTDRAELINAIDSFLEEKNT